MHTVDYYFEKSGLTIDDVAERAGLPLERVEAIVVGRWLPSPAERRKIAAAFEAAVEDISWGHSMDPRNVRYRRHGFRE